MNKVTGRFFDLDASVRANLPTSRLFNERVRSWKEEDASYCFQLGKPLFFPSRFLVKGIVSIKPIQSDIPSGKVEFDIKPIGWSPSNISDFITLRSAIGGIRASSAHHLSETLPDYQTHTGGRKIAAVNQQVFASCIAGLDDWIGCNSSPKEIKPYEGEMAVRELLHAFFLCDSDYDVQSIDAEGGRLNWLFNDSGETIDFIEGLLKLKKESELHPKKEAPKLDFEHKYVAAGNTGDYLFTVEIVKSKTKLNEFPQGTVILKYFRDGFENDFSIVQMHFHPKVNTLEILPSTYWTESKSHFLGKEDTIPSASDWKLPEYFEKRVAEDLKTRAKAGYDLLKGWAKSVSKTLPE